MKQANLLTAIEEARRFIKAATTQYNTRRPDGFMTNGWAVTGATASATRRASMDLTRALAALRKSKYEQQ